MDRGCVAHEHNGAFSFDGLIEPRAIMPVDWFPGDGLDFVTHYPTLNSLAPARCSEPSKKIHHVTIEKDSCSHPENVCY